MYGKRELLARWLTHSGLLRAKLSRGAWGLTILAYHRVLDIGDEDAFAADPELVSASVAGFRSQLKFLRKRWNPISLSSAITAIEQGKPLPPRSVVITFDDGHIDNYTHAFPVLRELGIPATIFLSTQYISGSEAFWFDRVATLLYCAPTGRHHLKRVECLLQLDSVASRRSESDRLLTLVKRVPDAQRLALLDELETLLGSYAPKSGHNENGAVTWDQVREMSRHDIEFGSHTVSHPVLAMQTEDRMRFELVQSRQIIHHETGQSVDLLAYPVGKSYAYNERVVVIAKECGYRAALAYIDGVNNPATADRFALRRIAVERYISHPLFMARMTFPGVFV